MWTMLEYVVPGAGAVTIPGAPMENPTPTLSADVIEGGPVTGVNCKVCFPID